MLNHVTRVPASVRKWTDVTDEYVALRRLLSQRHIGGGGGEEGQGRRCVQLGFLLMNIYERHDLLLVL